MPSDPAPDIHRAHGLRSTASSLLKEQNYNDMWIEKQMAYKIENKVKAYYNRAEYIEDRRKMLQEWSNYMDQLRLKA